MECAMCQAYVYDTLCRPTSTWGVNQARAIRHAKGFVPEFVRIAFHATSTDYLALRFVEMGGVNHSCCCILRHPPLVVAQAWIRDKLDQIGDLDDIHFEHAGERVRLRIRIPKPKHHKDDLYT